MNIRKIFENYFFIKFEFQLRYGNGQKYELTDKDKLWKELRNEHIADVSRNLPARLKAFAESKKNFLASKKRASELSSSSSQRGSMESIDSIASSGIVNYGADVTADGSNSSKSTTAMLRSLQVMVHQMPQYQKEAASYNALISITDYCLSACKENINAICGVEQVISNHNIISNLEIGFSDGADSPRRECLKSNDVIG